MWAMLAAAAVGGAIARGRQLGPMARGLTLGAGILLIVNHTAVAAVLGFMREMAGDWAELGRRSPANWGLGINALQTVSAVMSLFGLALLIAAVFAPRPASAS